MAAPTYAASGAYVDGSAASAAIPAPAGVAANSVVIVVMYLAGTIDQNVVAPAGWVAAEGSPLGQGGAVDPPNARLYVYWHRASGIESGPYTFTWDANEYRECQAHRYEGVIPTGNPFDSPTDTAADPASASTTPAVDVTTAGTDRLLVHAVTCWAGGTWTPAAGFTKRMQGAFGLISLFDKVQVAAGASGTVQATTTTANRRTAWLGALKPSAVEVTGTAAGVLGAVIGTAAGVRTVLGTAGKQLGAVVGIVTGARAVFGVAGQQLGALIGVATVPAPLPTIVAIMLGIEARLATIEGLRVSEIIPDTINPPCAIVGVPPIPQYRIAMGNAAYELAPTVTVLVSAALDRIGQLKLASYANPGGATSVKAAIEADRTLGGAAKDCIVESFRPLGLEDVGAIGYYGGVFILKCIAKGV